MTIKELLAKEGFSEESALKEQALLVALAKISHYQAECKSFESKYGMNFNSMKKKLKKQKSTEDFKEEDDFSDWEYADCALQWWKEKINEVENAD